MANLIPLIDNALSGKMILVIRTLMIVAILNNLFTAGVEKQNSLLS
jgi:hypothetical protein